MSCLHVSAWLKHTRSRALTWRQDMKTGLSTACLISSWSIVFGSRHSCLEFRFRDGVRTLVLHVSLCERAVSSLFSPALLSVHMCCVLWCCTQFVFLSASCIHVMSCAVWHAACVFHWLRALMLSCLVWTRGLWVFSLAACSCPVLNMGGDFVLLAMCLCFCFVWAHGFCLSFPCAMCCQLSANVNCLDPTHLVTWLLVHLPQRLPPFIISLCLQSCTSSSLMLPWWYPALSCLVLPFQAWLPAVLSFPYR